MDGRASADGTIRFSELDADTIGRVTAVGQMTETVFPLPAYKAVDGESAQEA